MDPLTRACQEYDAYLREGGEPVDLKALGFTTVSEREKVRKLHPSSLGPGLCDRRACYNVMADVGEIEKDVPETPEDNLGHRIGFIFQDFIAQALAYKGALIGMEISVGNEEWCGRIDLLVDAARIEPRSRARWLVDVKTVKGYTVDDRYPKEYHIAQVEKYVSLLDQDVAPVLFYVTRIDFQTAFYRWDWDGRDCILKTHEPGGIVKTIYGLNDDITASEATQLAWLKNGTLPERPFATPTDSFMCSAYQKGGYNRGRYKVTCPFFARCWERALPNELVFDKGDNGDTTYLPF